MEFEWEEGKNQQNIAKHGIDFSDAGRVFGQECWSVPPTGKIMVKIDGSHSGI
jgi:uncharacterized DUF497 family protein